MKVQAHVFVALVLVTLVQCQASYQLKQTITGKGFFGYVVAISSDGTTIATTNPGNNVVIYTLIEQGTWNVTAEISYPQPSWYDRTPDFGSSLALSKDGSIIAIGCPGDTYKGVSGTGTVYIFQWNEQFNNYTQVTRLANTKTKISQNLGSVVAMSDDGSVVSAGGHMSGSGCIWSRSGTESYSAKFCTHSNTGYYNDKIFGLDTSMSADGSVVAFVSAGLILGNDVVIYSLNQTTGNYEFSQVVYPIGVTTVAFSGDGLTFVAGSSTQLSGGYGQIEWYAKESSSSKIYRDITGRGSGYFVQPPYSSFGWDIALCNNGTILACSQTPYYVFMIGLDAATETMPEIQEISKVSYPKIPGFSWGYSVAMSADASVVVIGYPGYSADDDGSSFNIFVWQ